MQEKRLYDNEAESSDYLPETEIAVRYYGMLHDIVGKRSEILKVDQSAPAMELVKMIADRHGKRAQDFIFDRGGVRPGLAFAIDGVSIQRSSLAKTKCKDISEFVILPPISGGIS